MAGGAPLGGLSLGVGGLPTGEPNPGGGGPFHPGGGPPVAPGVGG